MPHSEFPSAPPRSGDRLKWVPYEDDYPDLVWEYTHLNEPELTDKFEELAMWGTLGDTDYATLQPCPNPTEASQDRHIIQDWDIDGKHWRFRGLFDAVLRCMRGTTVLIALVDPEGANLWVASLGDCTAILGTREPSGTWSTQTLSFNHNGTNASEATRFGFRTQRKVDDLLPRVLTPPETCTKTKFRYAVKIPGFWSSVVGKVMDIPGGPETKETASPRPRRYDLAYTLNGASKPQY
ncbi:hypothetical protein DFP72DRAFT_841339 [Ephemerocybe angulata]|uniref:PPM-type phosphatase domain-containing protein n=1 Tax=Ephemerocybe angulata TaxID=980116 RepID=A0A8H6ICU3_9AGAR|nr:hypothetical protein DFP72DRAFT_841339 [Tulosesus angulatus]